MNESSKKKYMKKENLLCVKKNPYETLCMKLNEEEKNSQTQKKRIFLLPNLIDKAYKKRKRNNLLNAK